MIFLWILLLCLIIYGIHYYLNESDTGITLPLKDPAYNLVDLRMQKYKNEIEKMVLESKEALKTANENKTEINDFCKPHEEDEMMNDLMQYIESKTSGSI